jgi:hypothetical protein
MRISNIVLHHSGGLGTDQYASTRHLTPKQIATYHKGKWNFPSRYITDPVLKYAGYNFIYDPKARAFFQCRAIGEPTAAQRGHNDDTVSICVIGNHDEKNGRSVDLMTGLMEREIASFLLDLINGNKRMLVIAPNTTLNFSIKRIYAHRFFSQTTCYGSFLSDYWAQDLVIKYKKVIVAPISAKSISDLKKRLALMQTLLRLYTVIFDLLNKLKLQKQTLGAVVEDRECDGFISI